MAKGLAPIFFTTCGVVVAGVVGYAIIEPNFRTEKVPVIIAEKVPEVAIEPEAKSEPDTQEVAKLETNDEAVKSEPLVSDAVSEEQIEPVTVAPVQPTFNVVRVEKDGSTVIAGQGPRDHLIELMDGDKKLSQTTVNSGGEFVFVLDKPLEPGAHELFLRAIPKDGDAIQSSSFAFVEVPEPDALGGVTVLIAESGKPSRVLQNAEAEPSEAEKVEVAKVDTPEPIVPEVKAEEQADVAGTNTVSDTASTSVSVAAPEEVADTIVKLEEAVKEENVVEEVVEEVEVAVASVAPVVETKLEPVLIEAADVEAGKIFIAGTGEPRASINIYLENELLGSVQVEDNGAFLFEGEKNIQAGRYDIRADMTKGGIEVLARAEVLLVHEPKVAQVPEPVEPEVVEPAPTQNEIAVLETKVEPEPTPEPVVVNEPELAPAVETTPTQEEVAAVEAAQPSVEVAASESVEPTVAAVEEPKKEIQTGSAVIIRRGDNLWTVARRNYGAGIRYTTIFDANRDQVRNPHKIYPGQVLKIPEDTQSVQ